MKKKSLSVILVIVLAAALMVTAAGCSSDSGLAQRVDRLEEENAALQEQIDAIGARVEALEKRSGLSDWTLTAAAWSSSNGATVTFTAIPANYLEGQSAALSVRLDGEVAASAQCAWDGSRYTASVDLDAADGYSYYCVLTSASGGREELALNTPVNPVDDALVYLGSSLSAYCNIVVDAEGWKADADTFTITSAYVQAQMPRITPDGSSITCTGAELILELNGVEQERKRLELPEGEGENSYELVLTDTAFRMPAMEDDYQIDLWLEVTLSNGQTLSTSGGSWYYNDSQLIPVFG